MSIPSRQNRKQVFQFARAETWALKPKQGKGPKQWGIADVLAEALRAPENSKHVLSPAAPRHIAGMTREQLLERHDDLCRETIKPGGRKARPDVHTLIGAVYSWPYKPEETDVELYAEWVKRSLAFHSAEFGVVHAAFEHSDESFPHLHVYTISNDARDLHAGERAKRATSEKPHQAYRDAMVGWQDRFYELSGAPCGLLRLGPRRRRLDRDAQKAERHAAIARAKYDLRRQKEIEQGVQVALEKIIRPEAAKVAAGIAEVEVRKRELETALADVAALPQREAVMLAAASQRTKLIEERERSLAVLTSRLAGFETAEDMEFRHAEHERRHEFKVEETMEQDGVRPEHEGFLGTLRRRVGEWWRSFSLGNDYDEPGL